MEALKVLRLLLVLLEEETRKALWQLALFLLPREAVTVLPVLSPRLKHIIKLTSPKWITLQLEE